MHGLFEFDVTMARQLIRERAQRTGEDLSLTAFLLVCLGQAIANHPEVHAYKTTRNRCVIFDDVDATLMFEVSLDGRLMPVGHVVRRINRRSVRDITQEIRSIPSHPLAGETGFRIRLGSTLPVRLAAALMGRIDWFPRLAKRMKGTRSVTSVGMMGNGGWGIAPLHHPLGLTVGGIIERPVLHETGSVKLHEFLCLTMCVDHDVVDGAPAWRCATDFQSRVENALVLKELSRESQSNVPAAASSGE